MAQNITLLGASYPNVPSVLLPKTGGGNASFVDVSGASLSSSDGTKILTGESAFGSDGKLISGTMPNYGQFPLVCQYYQTYSKTIGSSDSLTLTLNSFDLKGRSLKYLCITAKNFTHSVSGSSSSTRYLTSFTFDKLDGIERINAGLVKISRTSSAASISYSWWDGTYLSIKDLDKLASGEAKVHLYSSSVGYFKANTEYVVNIAG